MNASEHHRFLKILNAWLMFINIFGHGNLKKDQGGQKMHLEEKHNAGENDIW